MAAPAGNRWQQVEAIFYAALEQSPSERDLYVNQACGGDEALRSEVQSLLDASGKTVGFLKNRVEAAAHTLDEDEKSEIIGRQIGPFRLLRMIGEGGMGCVYLAERADAVYRQKVAIKLLHAGFAQTQRMLLRFGAERQILADLNHPNIARLLDGGVDNGLPYLVMEYVDGLFIDDYCKRKRLGTDARLHLFCTVCGAVEYAHKNLVVHRDIKPGNIIVGTDGVPKLLDFGIAKLLTPDGAELAQTRTVDRMMTPEYASPEQVRGDNITTSTDVYALGVLLYELLSGRKPFHLETTSPIDAARAICEQTPTAPSLIWKANPAAAPPDAARKLSGDLDNIVLMAMRKEPARRYVSVGALKDDVHALLGGYPIRARTDAWGYRSGKFIQRHKAAFVAAVVVALALVAFGIGMGLLARKAQRERLVAEREAQFLNSIFQATTPEQARGKSVSGPDLLDQGVKRVDTELSGEPELQARLLDNIGRAYSSMGLYAKSEGVLQRAYDLRKKVLGNSNLDTADTLATLADTIRLEADYKRADPLFRKALAVRQAKLNPADPLIAASLSSLGECLYLEDENQEAETVLRHAIGIERTHHEDNVLSTTENYLALVLQRKGSFGEAAQLLRESVAITQKAEGSDSPNYANSLHNLAGTLIDAGDLSGAETIDREVLAIRRKINGPGHPDLGYPLNNLGFIFLEKGDWASAEPFLKENLAVRGWPETKSAGAAAALNNWARLLQEKGDYKGADEAFQQAISIFRKEKGPSSWGLAKMLANLGLLRADESDYAEAERLERQAMEMRQKLGGNESPDFASSLVNVALLRSLQHDPESAEPLLRQALDIRKKELSPGHPAIISVETRLGEVLIDEGKPSEAEPVLHQAVSEIHAVPFPLTAWQVAEPEIALGVAVAAVGQNTEAAKLLHEFEPRLRNYPEMALYRQILRRAQSVRNHQIAAVSN
ncbi:MAG TPA: serine/threonine-protein kinase [Verrucomicrobiae bacterium]|nr:serine/threonine-protein kinase [Verrucomicrobiae bacterium]